LRVAILSDIHGNMVALQAALSDIEEGGGTDRTLCLGDVASVGPQPKQVVEFLRRAKWPCVMGNTDEVLAKSTPESYDDSDKTEEEKERMRALDRWTAEQLDSADRKFLAGFRPTIEVRVQSVTVLGYHGSPRSNREGILSTTPDEKLSAIIKSHAATVFAGGHTHVQMLRRLEGAMVINPGSVGLPYVRDSKGRFRNPAWAEYAMVTVEGRDLGVELCRARYDLAALKKAVRESGLPDPRYWLEDWF
jgi:putative phosphoesterase